MLLPTDNGIKQTFKSVTYVGANISTSYMRTTDSKQPTRFCMRIAQPMQSI